MANILLVFFALLALSGISLWFNSAHGMHLNNDQTQAVLDQKTETLDAYQKALAARDIRSSDLWATDD